MHTYTVERYEFAPTMRGGHPDTTETSRETVTETESADEARGRYYSEAAAIPGKLRTERACGHREPFGYGVEVIRWKDGNGITLEHYERASWEEVEG